MKHLFLTLFLLSACSNNSSGDDCSEPTNTVVIIEKQRQAPEEKNYIAPPKDRDGCITQHFAADNIPSDFEFDPSCPPDIWFPPKYIPPWDPGPVIKTK